MTVTEDSTQSLHQEKLQRRLHKLISTSLLTSIKSIAEKRGNKAAELHSAKKKQKLATRDVRDPNCAKRPKPDTNWVRNFPSRPLTWLKPKYFCPSDTHWQEYVEYGLRLLYYCILHWDRPVSKSRQIELSNIARNLEPTCAAFDTWQFPKYLTL